MTATVELEHVLPPLATSAGEARRLLREALARGGVGDWVDNAQVAISELVTNALVHAGTPIRLRVRVTPHGVRVEVGDGSPQLPHERDYPSTAATGRGLHLVGELVDSWGAYPEGDGKVVWFEIREATSGTFPTLSPVAPSEEPPVLVSVQVELLNVPLLMHAAWQEHASALLREYLLIRLDDDLDTIENHARASEAMSILFEQVPAPDLGEHPEAIMAGATGPAMSAERLLLRVPIDAVQSFRVLDELLEDARTLAWSGDLLSPPTQPEVRAMRRWICGQVAEQSASQAPTPWTGISPDAPPPVGGSTLEWDPEAVAGSDQALLAADDANRILAVSRPALRMLRYDASADLVGRRLLSIIPARFHQAHVAGFTLHLTNGRGPLLGNRVDVPVLRGDGTEQVMGLLIESQNLPEGRRLFTAEFLEVD